MYSKVCIAKYTCLEKAKRVVIWDGFSKEYVWIGGDYEISKRSLNELWSIWSLE